MHKIRSVVQKAEKEEKITNNVEVKNIVEERFRLYPKKPCTYGGSGGKVQENQSPFSNVD